MKKAYVIAEVLVTNPDGYAGYRELSSASVAQYGGTFIARGGLREQWEGEDAAHNSGWRSVIIEFPSLEQARTWYHSPEYTKARAVRQANSTGRIYVLEGA